MTLAESLLKQMGNRALSRDERAQLQCQIAADLEHRGQYDAARDVLGKLWQLCSRASSARSSWGEDSNDAERR